VRQSYVYPDAQEASGRGAASVIPHEIRRWNWGAFFLNWIWGLSHGVYISLLMFVPLANLAIPFVLGANGNEYAWRNRKWRSTEEFLRSQRIWTWWGFGAWLVGITLALSLSLLRKDQ
jgi:hypothetical protein